MQCVIDRFCRRVRVVVVGSGHGFGNGRREASLGRTPVHAKRRLLRAMPLPFASTRLASLRIEDYPIKAARRCYFGERSACSRVESQERDNRHRCPQRIPARKTIKRLATIRLDGPLRRRNSVRCSHAEAATVRSRPKVHRRAIPNRPATNRISAVRHRFAARVSRRHRIRAQARRKGDISIARRH